MAVLAKLEQSPTDHDNFSGLDVSMVERPKHGVNIVGTRHGDLINPETSVDGQPLPTKWSDTISGEAGDDTLDGGLGDDLLRGGQGADVLDGKGGADVLDGQGGANTLAGGSGDDLYLSVSNEDRIVESRGKGYDTVIASTNFHLADTQSVKLRMRSQLQISTRGMIKSL